MAALATLCLFWMTKNQEQHLVYLGLGSNVGNRQQYIQRAVTLISERIGTILRQSSLIETEPWGFQSQTRFLNGVILCSTTLTPRQVLRITQQIERLLGRTVKSRGKGDYHDRTIDIDILTYDDITVDEPDLKIPHPLMHERDFVMKPLNEVKGALELRSLATEGTQEEL